MGISVGALLLLMFLATQASAAGNPFPTEPASNSHSGGIFGAAVVHVLLIAAVIGLSVTVLVAIFKSPFK